MSDSLPLVVVEGEPQKRFAEALLQPYQVEIIHGYTSSGAIAHAQSTLMRTDRLVALLIESRSENEREIAELRGSAKRLLTRASTEGWCVAIAVPRLDAWAMTDPRIKQDFESYLEGKASFIDRSLRFAALTKEQPFDATELYRTVADFRGLVHFLRQHAQAEGAASPL